MQFRAIRQNKLLFPQSTEPCFRLEIEAKKKSDSFSDPALALQIPPLLNHLVSAAVGQSIKKW